MREVASHPSRLRFAIISRIKVMSNLDITAIGFGCGSSTVLAGSADGLYQSDDDGVTWSATGLPDGLSVDPATGEIAGTIGGDDFVVICGGGHAERLAQTIVRRFDAGVGDLHDARDLANGYLESRTRTGEVERVPYMVPWTVITPGIHKVVARAYDAGGTDNMTALVLRVPGQQPVAP